MVTYKVILRNDYVSQRSGKAQLYLQFFVDKKRLRIPLSVHVKPEHWNAEKQIAKSNCPDAENINLVIQNELARVNKIFVDARLTETEISPEYLLREYSRPDLRNDFLKFMERDIRHRKGILKNGSLKHHLVVLTKLKYISTGKIKFSELNFEMVEKFEKYLISTGVGSNTIWANMKVFKTYVNRAIKRGIRIKNPFDNYKLTKVRGHRTYLNKDELNRLINLYYNPELTQLHKNTLQYFLFACVTGGIRYGDIKKLKPTNIINDCLVFFPEKTSKQNKRAQIPLNDISYHFMNSTGDNMFNEVYTEQATNRNLKDIALMAGIEKRISFHVSRHTFATLFLASGGMLTVLRDLMQHGKIETTMIYDHINEEENIRNNQMKTFSDFLNH